MAALDCTPPPGYRALSLLDRQTHAGQGIDPASHRFAAALHAVYLSLPEFVPASRSCPVVFISAGDGPRQPVMVTGIAPGANLCVNNRGDWAPEIYCPAYVRRYPFCTARVAAGGGQAVICVDESGLDSAQPSLFDADGTETPAWQERLQLIKELDTAGRQTELFSARLDELGLFEPFDADIRPNKGQPRMLAGMWRVNESRLNALPAGVITELMRSGFLSRVYAHLMSLDNFHRLLGLEAARQAEAPRH